jgi:AsmA family protein
MASRRKIIFVVLAVSGLLLLSGIVAVKLLLTDERLSAFARERVKNSLGRELKLEDLSLQFRPLPTLLIRNAELGNPSWAKEAFFLHADEVTARLDLTSLLRGQIEPAALSVKGLSVNLEISPDNRKNWQMQTPAAKRDTGGSSSASLRLASLQLEDVRIRYAKHAEPLLELQIEELHAHADPGLRKVRMDARILRNEIALQLEARLDDVSGIGREGAVSSGTVELSFGSAQLGISGSIPISGTLRNHKLNADFNARSTGEMLRFFGIANIDLAPIKASVELREDKQDVRASNLFFQIGELKINGNGKIHVTGSKPYYRASLAVQHLDWTQTMRDFGRPSLPPKPAGQLFRDTPLGWQAVSAMQKITGKTELRIQRVKLRSGIELKDLKADIDASEKLLRIDGFSFSMLDGRVKGNLALEGRRRTAKLNLEMNKVSLGKWLAARGHRLTLSGGPMDLKASLSASGLSMKDLAESLAGPVNISVGPAKLQSKQMQQAETWLIGLAPVFSTSEADQVNLACMSAYLPFEKGRAASEPIGGIRSDASQFLASGYVDLKQQTLDLRGRVRARSGVSLGVSNIAGGNLKIAGRIDKPAIGLDPEGTPGALARIGAAIMTSGVSILATALWDAANPASDPCQITFSAHEKQRPSRPKNEVNSQQTVDAN